MTDTMASFEGSVLLRYVFYIKIIMGDLYTWMCRIPEGDGELESQYQGWSRDSSFAQETGEIIQSQSRIDSVPSLLAIVQDVRTFLAHLPSLFYFVNLKRNIRYQFFRSKLVELIS